MSDQPTREPSLSILLNQFEDIGGPETYGPEGLAIMIALWRKSNKLNWLSAFTMTNTELQVQTGIQTRKTLNVYRKKLTDDGLIDYNAPPLGKSRGEYKIKFNLLADPLVVTSGNNFQEVDPQPVTSGNSFIDVSQKVVTSGTDPRHTVLKDLKDLNNTITTITESASLESINFKKIESEKLLIIDAYCELHKKLDFHVRVKEREIMGKMIAGGVLSPFIIQTMTKLYDDKHRREEEEGLTFSPPTTFKYYENAIYEAWNNEKTITFDVPSSQVALGTQPERVYRTKQQRELDDLDKIIEEEKRREQIRSS